MLAQLKTRCNIDYPDGEFICGFNNCSLKQAVLAFQSHSHLPLSSLGVHPSFHFDQYFIVLQFNRSQFTLLVERLCHSQSRPC
ncbi:hypothetical protein NQZ68_001881 [Dissostichus eleginoides]|nr:hypothetical protein NQZ68_001881 [Dissostichus eleginoides]